MSDSKKKTGFIDWLVKHFSVEDKGYMVTHVGYKWAGSRMLRETHVRYHDGTVGVIHTNH